MLWRVSILTILPVKASEAGAGFVMFTLGQNSGYYCSPNAVFDSIVGTSPGDLCSKRDLPMDLIKSLKKYNIPVILVSAFKSTHKQQACLGEIPILLRKGFRHKSV